jgi:TonB-linked SusC/RagA family outer membrane protein
MEDDLTTLSEVVVVGYGVQKKALNTGANLQVEGDQLQRLSTTNALQALQGQAAGVQITSTSGQPGEALKVVIRGLGTNNNASPLFVVDGVLTSDISYLNNADIETVTVLKDAASAAIYGSQAANGVVLITTKGGKAGAPAQITFDSYYGVQNVARKVDMLNSREYASIINEAAINSGKLPYFTSDEIAAMGNGTNWMDEMFVKDAVTQNYTVGASGGSETSTFSTSLSYMSQAGIVGGKDFSNYERYNFRINSEHKFYNDRVVMGQHLTLAYVENKGIAVGNQYSNSLRGAFTTSPFVPMYDADGNFWDNSEGWNTTEANPYALMVYTNQNERNNQKLLGDVYLQVELLKNLKFRTSLGLDYYANERHSFTPIYRLSAFAFSDFTKVSQGMGKGRTWLFDNLLTYTFDLPGEHHFDAMVGSSAYQFKGTQIWGDNANLIFNELPYAWLSNATNQDGSLLTLGGKPDNEDRRMSYFGRLNYNFKETYLFNATFRVDGSSRFADHWGYFPSLSAGWVITNESFMSPTSDWMNSLKLRASWGQVGNLNIDPFQYLALVQFSNTNYIFGPTEGSDGLVPGAFPKRLANPNVKWETSEQTNIGFDAQFLSGALTVNLDWYSKITKDWLVIAPILATAGADAPYINGGNVENKGIELALSYNGKIGDLGYTIGVNGAYNKNKVTDIPTLDETIHGATNQLYNNAGEFYRAQAGFPIGYFWGLETNGLFQTEEDVANYRSGEGVQIQPSAMPGDVRYVDRNNDGVIDNNDRTNIGNPNPDFVFGFNISANYKGFDFSVLANGVAGNELVQAYRNQSGPYGNYTSEILDRWHGPGSSNRIPRVTEDNRNWTNFSDLYIHDGSFLRISNITLGYDLTKLLSKKYLNQVRIFASVQNLYTFTKYTGMDPEVGFGIDNGPTDRFSSGIDLGYYPRPRTIMAGLNIKF